MPAATIIQPAHSVIADSRLSLGDRIVDGMLLATVLGVSWTKLFVNLGGKLDLSLVVAGSFLAGFGMLRAMRGDWRLPRIASWLAGWSGIMLIIDLLGLLLKKRYFSSPAAFASTIAFFWAGVISMRRQK